MISDSCLSLNIRSLIHGDLERILEVQSSALRTSSPSYSSIQIESLVRSQASARLDPNEQGFVAEHENEIVGFVSFLAKGSKIAGLYVHPDFMRQGIGKQLLETVERHAIDEGYEFIAVTSSLVAVEFYKNSGYHHVLKSGFYSEGRIWVTCEELEKQLVCRIEAKRLHRQTNFAASMVRSVVISIQSNFWVALTAGFILFKIISFLISSWS
jgi:GNAT superfamily N-acetyltransferase